MPADLITARQLYEKGGLKHVLTETKLQNSYKYHGKIESRPQQRAYTKAIVLQVMYKKMKCEGIQADRNEEAANQSHLPQSFHSSLLHSF